MSPPLQNGDPVALMAEAPARSDIQPPQPPEAGPQPGQERSPVLVPFLTYITLQFYLYYWIWTVSEEVERFDPYASSPRPTARWGVPLAIAGTLVVGGGVATLFVADLLIPLGSILEGNLGLWLGVLGGVILLGGLAYFVGSLLLWISYWRVWRAIGTHERNLDYEPVEPSLMLGLWVGSLLVVGLIPLVGWAVQLAARSYVLYRTQRGLNRLWTGAAGGYEPAAPRSPLSAMAPVGPGPEPRPPAPRSPRPPPLRAGDTSLPPPSVPRSHATARNGGGPRVPFACEACGNREQVPARRPLRVHCPACGESQLLGRA